MAYVSSSTSAGSTVMSDEDPVLDGLQARFAMGDMDLSQIMRASSSGSAGTGRDIMGLMTSLMAHREENPHVDAPAAPTDPYADSRTAAALSAGIGAMMTAAAGIGAAASGSGGIPAASGSAPSFPAAPAASAEPSATTSETPSVPAAASPETTSTPSPPSATATATSTATTRRPARDSDHDGVRDSRDRCGDTPAGTAVDAHGCPAAAPVAVPVVEPPPPPRPPTAEELCDPALQTCGPEAALA